MSTIGNILIVDDNPKYIADALPMYGYDVEVATNGAQALKILNKNIISSINIKNSSVFYIIFFYEIY